MSFASWWGRRGRRPDDELLRQLTQSSGGTQAGVSGAQANLADPQQLAGHLATLVLSSYLRDRRSDLFWRRLKTLGVLLLGAAGLAAALLSQAPAHLIDWPLGSLREKVGVIRIEGPIGAEGLASAAKILPVLERAFEDPGVKAIALQIDSPGGAAGEAERIYKGLERLRAKHGKPVTAVINNLGASAAYLIALHADRIVAGEYSMVGSIGAKITTWELYRAAQHLQVSPRTYASGELKNMLDPFEPPTPAGQRKAQALVDEIGATFAAKVKERRGAKLAAGVNYASGEVWTGAQARQLGLIDDIGTLDTIFADMRLAEFGPVRPRSVFAPEALSWVATVMEALTGSWNSAINVPQLR